MWKIRAEVFVKKFGLNFLKTICHSGPELKNQGVPTHPSIVAEHSQRSKQFVSSSNN